MFRISNSAVVNTGMDCLIVTHDNNTLRILHMYGLDFGPLQVQISSTL